MDRDSGRPLLLQRVTGSKRVADARRAVAGLALLARRAVGDMLTRFRDNRGTAAGVSVPMVGQGHRSALPDGVELERYHVETALGTDLLGVTYRARDRDRRIPVTVSEFIPQGVARRGPDGCAVRPVSAEMAEAYMAGLEQFLRQADALCRFSHPNVESGQRYFAANGTAYLTERFESGEALSEMLERVGRLDDPDVKNLLFPLLGGLEALHQAGLFHCAVEPGNIRMGLGGAPVLVGIGAARQEVARKFGDPAIGLTPGYAAIEQYGMDSQIGPWTDIYGLGAVLYRAITGKVPPASSARHEVVTSGGGDPLIPLIMAGSGRLDAADLAWIDRALALMPDERPQSVADWQALSGEEPLPRRVIGAPVTARRAPARQRPRGLSLGRVAASLAVVAIMVGGGIGWYVNQSVNWREQPIAFADSPPQRVVEEPLPDASTEAVASIETAAGGSGPAAIPEPVDAAPTEAAERPAPWVAVSDDGAPEGAGPQPSVLGRPRVKPQQVAAAAPDSEPESGASPENEEPLPQQVAALDFARAGLNAAKENRYDQAVNLYTQALQSGALPDDVVAQLHYMRANAHYAAGQSRPAVADYSEVIRRRPDDPDAYLVRANIFGGQGLHDRAVADFDKVVSLSPGNALALRGRGHIFFFQGRFDAAAASFDESLRGNADDVYAVIWRYLAQRRAGTDELTTLAAGAAQLSETSWPIPAIALFLGEVDPDRILAEAERGNPDSLLERQCEALFYVGQYHIINGRPDLAVDFFRRTVATGVTRFYEHMAARAELRRMGLTP